MSQVLCVFTSASNPNSFYGLKIWGYIDFSRVWIIYWKYRNCQNLGPFDKNPNAPNKNTDTQILCAAINGYTEIVKILAPLTDNPNAPDKWGETPIFWAACEGFSEIVEILAPLTDDPNAPDNTGRTPHLVARNEEIRRYLQLFSPSKKQKTGPSTKTYKKSG